MSSAPRDGSLRPLPVSFRPYGWAMSTREAARVANVEPERILRFDGNTPPHPPPYARTDTVAGALRAINTYAHGGYEGIHEAIAGYAGVGADNVVLGAGADDLILLCARAFAGPGDTVAIVDEPTYPVYRLGAALAGAEVGDVEPAVTFCCRPHNPTGALPPLPDARPLVVDEAYYEFAGETAAGLIEDGVIVIRTFSKAFGLAGARIGYALADAATAAGLNARQAPASVSAPSVALALEALAQPPDVTPVIEERERLYRLLQAAGFDPLPSWANFVFVPLPDGRATEQALLRRHGLLVRGYDDGVRITVRDTADDDLLVAALQEVAEAVLPD